MLQKSAGLRIRAGSGGHRFIGIWHVMVKDRVFVRSWSVKENGWYRTFFPEKQSAKKPGPHGTIRVGGAHGVEIAVNAKRITNKALRDAIDRAYLEKYSCKGAIRYARDLGSEKSRATTVEFLPK